MKVLNYPGSKWGMAAEIIGMMPPHRSYVEPFFGSGAVFFNKPKSPIETMKSEGCAGCAAVYDCPSECDCGRCREGGYGD